MGAALGNDEVIKALETLLAHARAGRFGYLIACMVDQNEKPMGGWFGSVVLEKSCMKSLEQMSGMLDRVVLNKTLPDRDPSVGADRVCYNVPMSPMSYDFLMWLVDAEMNRIMKGAPAPLKVAFWFGRDGNCGFDSPARQQMFLNVARPALALIGAVEDPDAVDGHYKAYFCLRDIVNAHKRGFDVPKLRAPAANRAAMEQRYGAQQPVTITLRESSIYSHRNSNVVAWRKFASYLKGQGERVVFVRDTARATEEIKGFETCPEAALNLHDRLALYETAKMNLFVSNGPASMGFFSDWPWIQFVKIEPDDHEYTPNTARFWRENFIAVGSQFAWSMNDQRIVWDSDDYENLVNAWENVKASYGVAAE